MCVFVYICVCACETCVRLSQIDSPDLADYVRVRECALCILMLSACETLRRHCYIRARLHCSQPATGVERHASAGYRFSRYTQTVHKRAELICDMRVCHHTADDVRGFTCFALRAHMTSRIISSTTRAIYVRFDTLTQNSICVFAFV